MQIRRFLFKCVLAVALSVGGTALAQNALTPVEFGVQYDGNGLAPYIYITRDFYVGRIVGVKVFLAPSIEVVIRDPIEGFAQLQLLLETPPFTIDLYGGVRSYNGDFSFYLRTGILLEL